MLARKLAFAGLRGTPMLRLRTHVLICLGFFLALLVVGWGGALLQGLGVSPPAGVWRWVFLALMFALLLGFAFSAVPVMVLLVTGVQGRVGGPGATMAAPRWQKTIIYVMWALMALGAAVAIPAAFVFGAFDQAGAGPGVPGVDPGPSQGTLVAKPGMSVDEVKRGSSLPIQAPPSPATISGGVVFDFVVAGTQIRFPHCRYYFMSTYSKDPEHIEGMSIGTSVNKVDRKTLEANNAAVRSQLAADGWLAGHEEYRTQEDQALHGGATRGPEGDIWLKGDTVLSIENKRMDDPVEGEDANTAGEWIQTVSLWTHEDYPFIERYAFAAPQ
jgi:hypothetical protein